MADPVVIVEKIVNIAYAIKEAVETVRENKEECRGIEQRVLRVSDLLSLLKGSEMMKHRAMSRALEDLEDAVSRAHEVVTACQGRNILCLFCFAGKLAKKLRQVKDDISQRMMLAIFASHVAVFVVTKGHYSDQPSFFIPRNQYPLSKHPPSPPPLAVVKDLSPSLPTHLPPPVVIGEDLVSRLPPHVPPSPSLVVADVSNIPPRSHAHLPPSLSSLAAYIPPATPPRTNLAPPQSKYLPSYPPTKPPPPPPPPATYIPSSTPANLAPHLSKRLLPRPPTKLPSPQPPPPRSAAYIPPPTPPPANLAPPSKHLPSRSPSPPPRFDAYIPPPTRLPPPPLLKHLPPLAQPPLPPPSTPIADIAPPLPKHLYLCPSEHVPPRAPTQRTGEISVPASGSVSSTLSVEDLSGKSEVQDERKKVPSGSEVSSPPFPGLTKFSLSELKAATHNFSEENKIGSSDFGTVYKGVLCNRLVVAIKEFRDPPPFLMARICAELLVASELQSKKVEALGSNGRKLSLTAGVGKSENTLSGRNENIIGVLGYGHEFMWKHRRVDQHIFLVEEYMPNGNMDNIIYGSRLNWSSRFRIIQGLARGLHYLHEQNIVHMNMKPANILLDSDMNPKITDFGIARVLDEPVIHDNNIAGTVGYMSPEYILEGFLSTKYDVYSFGVILLETISGMCRAEPARHHASVPWAWKSRECQQMDELFDLSLCEESQLMDVKWCLEIGLLCTQFEPAERPTMAIVLEMLSGKKELPTPKQRGLMEIKGCLLCTPFESAELPIPKQPEYTKETAKPGKAASCKVRSRR